MSLKEPALIAALGELLLSLYVIAPGAFGISWVNNQDFARGLGFVESLALAVFLLLGYRESESLLLNAHVRLVALIAAVALGIENLSPTYGTVRGAIASSENLFAWKYQPVRQFTYVFAPTIPTIAVISLIVFLLVVHHTALRPSPNSGEPEVISERMRIRIVTMVVLGAGFLEVGEFVYFLAANPVVFTQWFPVLSAVLRLTSLISLVSFFLVVFIAVKPVGGQPG
jgi:hypothetical protein